MPRSSQRLWQAAPPLTSASSVCLLAEAGVERLAVGLADGPVAWRGEPGEVATDCCIDAGARVALGGVAVTVVGDQHGVAEAPCGDAGVGVSRAGVIAVAENEDRVLGGGVPRPGVALSAAGAPGGARRPEPPQVDRRDHDALTEGADDPRPG